MIEWTIESRKTYGDPFNDVDIDVIFERDGNRWRVPMFWRGDNHWTVRFAPPTPGEYRYRVESTDRSNRDFNGRHGRVTITVYSGSNTVLKRGALQVSQNRRYFEQADGTPFYWLGDTWWTGLSGRLPWEGFKQLTADRRAKRFTVIQIVAGLVPDEANLTDPGFCNEGGCVWGQDLQRINPSYFDFADRRIEHLVDNGLAPAIVGGWRYTLPKIGVAKMKKHWRYVIARYGAYPVFWVVGGEVYDPPLDKRHSGALEDALYTPGWTEVARYVRSIDPYRHPISVHEVDPPFDTAIQDESLTDFDLFQAGHRGWPSVATAVALLNKHYARTGVTKPLVVGEIGYEKMAGENFEGYQRAAFWLSMLNGAAGFTYGTISTALAYSTDKPFDHVLLSPYSWEEAMHFPGSTQVALGARFLKQYPWWKMSPHPEWVAPRGTTLLEPNDQINRFNIDLIGALAQKTPPNDDDLPLGEWSNARGNWRLPYAAGIPGKVRLIYLPYSWFARESPVPAVQNLEAGVRYHVYYWEPTLGTKYDLGIVEHAASETGKVDISHVDRKLHDASGKYRGEMRGPVWADYGKNQRIDQDGHHPEKPPLMGDWVLVLEAQ